MAPRLASSGSNLVLASGLALLSYVPFEYVAKGSLITCAILFIFDPIPPLSRLLALVSLCVVYFLSKLHKQAVLEAEQNEEVTIVDHAQKDEQEEQLLEDLDSKTTNNTSDETKENSKPKGD